MAAYGHIKKCLELSDEVILAAIESREDTLALLKHLAKIAAPNTGVAKVLVLFARMGTSACEWFDGDLRVDVRDSGTSCTIEVTAELGMGMRERIMPATEYAVPLEEFTRAVERVPDRIVPLKLMARSAKVLSLGVSAEVRQTSLPPPPIKIAEDSFFTAAAMKPQRAPVIEGHTPSLPIVGSSRRIKVATKASSAPPPPKAKSMAPKAKSIAPKAKSIAPKAKSIAPKAKSIAPKAKSIAPKAKSIAPKAKSIAPKAKSIPPKAKSIPPKAASVRPPAKPVLARPPLPRPKAREADAKPEKATPPLPIIEPGLPLVMPESTKMKSKRPSKGPMKAGRLSLEARLAHVEDEEAVDSGWGDADD